MKFSNNTLFVSLLGLSLTLMPLSANDIGDLEVEVDELNQAVELKMDNINTNEINFVLYNSFERVMFADRAEMNETFESSIDFSDLRRGTYTLVSESGNMRYHKVIKVRKEEIELTDSYFTFTPVIEQDENTLRVYYLNGLQTDIQVSIEDISTVYFDSYFSADEFGVFTKDFSLENLTPGTYTFNLSANGDVFQHTIEVK